MNEDNPNRFADLFALDPKIDFLNHGSFGACPKELLEHQRELRDLMEREPVQFFVKTHEKMLDEVRECLARFVRAKPGELAFVVNATYAVNSVLRSLKLEPGDELLTTNHEYNACRNVLDFVAAETGAQVVNVPVPFPLSDKAQVTEAVLSKVTGKTRVALLDHVTSPTGLVLPMQDLIHGLSERGVDTLVDGAHALGMLDLDLTALGAAYYTSNCHKWLCTPKGAAFLYVRQDRQDRIRPACISHAANSPRTERSRFIQEFDWTGTHDPTPVLCVPKAIEFLTNLLPGGIGVVRKKNRDLALYGRDRLCEALHIKPPCPDDMIGSLAAVPL
ncbi:MAG: aminotransferase class V-fold PLP-dependent enzyme, partial [Planctomycetota bacterium]